MRCQPGDLAMVLKARRHHTAVGRVCEVLCIVPNDRFIELPSICGLADEGLEGEWLVRMSVEGIPEHGTLPDEWLLPIRPQSDEAEETEDELEPVSE